MSAPAAVSSQAARGATRFKLFRIVLLLLFGVFFLTPILALVEFSTRGVGLGAARTLDSWRQIFDYPDLVEHFRSAHGVAVADEQGDQPLEERRQAMVDHRYLFDALLQGGDAQRTRRL